MKKGIGIALIVLLIPLGIVPVIIVYTNQPALVWHCDGPASGSTFVTIPAGTPFTAGYVISISDYFDTYGDYEYGSVTFINTITAQQFLFEYDLGHGGYQDTESDSELWNLPPGYYYVEWINNKVDPDYDLTQVSILYPVERFWVVGVIGLLALCIALSIFLLYKILKKPT